MRSVYPLDGTDYFSKMGFYDKVFQRVRVSKFRSKLVGIVQDPISEKKEEIYFRYVDGY